MLNLSFVRSFVGLVETGSFQKAAQRLNIAQPTLSQHLRKLEDQLGVQLIERSHAGSRPTPQGERFLGHARQLLSNAVRAAQSVQDEHLTIGCSGNIASYFMTTAFKAFLDESHWSGTWNIQSAPNPQIADMLLAQSIDLAAMEWPLSHPDVVTHFWRTADMTVILPPDHAYAGRDEISVEEFLSLEVIGGEPGSGTGTLLRETLGAGADRLKVRANVGSTEAVKRAVAAGIGASIVLTEAVRADVAGGRLARIRLADTTMNKTFYLAHHKSTKDFEIAAKVAAFLAPPKRR
ncbi:MAG: LysR family transcriptional regulator [Pseudomonadota bacterium]